jgi:glycolate oxidase FAD binding subunit
MIDRLREVAGQDTVRDGSWTAFRVHGMTPTAVVSPADAEQAAAVLRVCSENGWIVETAGAGTWLDWGRPPARVDVVLSSERLAAIHEYSPADLTISVGAGTPLAEVAETVAFDRQMLGLDPPARPGATTGATIATASAGPLRFSIGSPRDIVLGLELVTGDGRVVRLGGRVVKNVAGYDLVRLVVGSRGTLGFITRAHLRLRPAPEAEATALYAADSPRPLVDLALGPAARVWPAALEIFGPATASALGLERKWTLAVRCRGNEAFTRAARDRLGTFNSASGANFPAELEAARLWESLASLEAHAAIAFRLASLPGRLGPLLELAGVPLEAPSSEPWKQKSENGLDEWLLAAHAGSGLVRIWRPDAPPGLDAQSLAARVAEMRTSLVTDGGTATLPVLPAPLLDAIDPFGVSGPVVDLMRGLKAVFDPAGILLPGRYVV